MVTTFPACNVRSLHGFLCTEQRDHSGSHIATMPDGLGGRFECERWAQVEASTRRPLKNDAEPVDVLEDE